MTLSRLADAAIQGNLAAGSAYIATVPQAGNQCLQDSLRDLAGSAFELGVVGQDKGRRETNGSRIKVNRVGARERHGDEWHDDDDDDEIFVRHANA